MRHFEDFCVGESETFGAHAVTAGEIAAFAKAYDASALGRTDADGTPVASPWLVCALQMKMMCDGFILETTSLGAPGIDEAHWLAPVRAGDVLHVRRTTLDARRSASRPELGLVRSRFEMFDAAGETKLTCENWIMFATREAAGS